MPFTKPSDPVEELDSVAARRFFDEQVRWQVAQLGAEELSGVDVVLGIPFYTERDNVVSQLVTLRQVFQERQQRALIVVVGELARSEFVSEISVGDLEEEDPCLVAPSGPTFARVLTFWKPHRRYQGKPWSVRAAQVVAASASAHLMIVDADIQFNHWELSAHSLMRTLLEPLQGRLPPRADPGDGSDSPSAASEDSTQPSPACEASVVTLNAPRSYLSDDGVVHLFSCLLQHATLGTAAHQPHGGEFSLNAKFNMGVLADEEAWLSGARFGVFPSGAKRALMPPVAYDDSYCVQAQLITRALVSGRGPVTEYLMRGKWHAKIGLSKILNTAAGSDKSAKSRIDLVTERMFDDALALAQAGFQGACSHLDVAAAGRTYRSQLGDSREGGLGMAPTHGWVARSRQMEGGLRGVAGATIRAGGVYPDPLAQNMCVLAPPIARKELWIALKQMLREFLANDLASLPSQAGRFATTVLPLLHCAVNAPKGAFRTLPENPPAGSPPAAAVFGPGEWGRATAGLLNAYRAAPVGSDARRSVVHANRLSWLLGSLAFLNATVGDDWGSAHERLDAYCAAFRSAYLEAFLNVTL